MRVHPLAQVELDAEGNAAGDQAPTDGQSEAQDRRAQHGEHQHPQGRRVVPADRVDRAARQPRDGDGAARRRRGERQRGQQPALVRTQEAEQSPEGCHSLSLVVWSTIGRRRSRFESSALDDRHAWVLRELRLGLRPLAQREARAAGVRHDALVDAAVAEPRGRRRHYCVWLAKGWRTRYARFSRLPGERLNWKMRGSVSRSTSPASGELLNVVGSGVVRVSVEVTGWSSSASTSPRRKNSASFGSRTLLGLFFGRPGGSTATTWSASV